MFAVSKLFLGDADRDGTESPNAWKNYGLDIDHRASVAQSCGLCQPLLQMSPMYVYPDGNGGIDNSFGMNILPIILGVEPAEAHEVSQEIGSGARTLLLRIDGLGASSGTMGGAFFHAGPLGHNPKWDGTDAWPVTEDSLLVPSDPSSAKVSFKISYLAGNRWVSDPPATILVELPLFGQHLRLVIHNAVFVVDLAADRKSGTNGILSGILDVNQLAAEPGRLGKFGDQAFCSDPGIAQSFAELLSEAADILMDGSQDPNVPCSGISIGLGFEMRAAMIGGVTPAPLPVPDPCVDAGAPDGG